MYVCMYCAAACSYTTHLSRFLSPPTFKNLCCCCSLSSLRMRNAHLLRQHVAKNSNNNKSRRIVLICFNLLFLLCIICLLCHRTGSAVNCAAPMRERRCWTQPNVSEIGLRCVLTLRRRKSAAESGRQTETERASARKCESANNQAPRCLFFFAGEYACVCLPVCVCCLHCQRFVHSFFVISSY